MLVGDGVEILIVVEIGKLARKGEAAAVIWFSLTQALHHQDKKTIMPSPV